MTIKNPVVAIKIRIANKRYEKMIAASQAKLAEIPVIAGYTHIYA